VNNSQQTISNSPTLITGLPTAIGALFIKNLHNAATIQVDSSNTFNHFPQLIPPQSGVYLSPHIGGAGVYAQSSISSSDVQVISASRPNPTNYIIELDASLASTSSFTAVFI
jgi:hypothetical protein